MKTKNILITLIAGLALCFSSTFCHGQDSQIEKAKELIGPLHNIYSHVDPYRFLEEKFVTEPDAKMNSLLAKLISLGCVTGCLFPAAVFGLKTIELMSSGVCTCDNGHGNAHTLQVLAILGFGASTLASLGLPILVHKLAKIYYKNMVLHKTFELFMTNWSVYKDFVPPEFIPVFNAFQKEGWTETAALKTIHKIRQMVYDKYVNTYRNKSQEIWSRLAALTYKGLITTSAVASTVGILKLAYSNER